MGIFDYLLMDARVSALADRMALIHERAQGRIEADHDSLRDEQRALRRDLEQLATYSRAVAELLEEKGLITRDELIARMARIDI